MPRFRASVWLQLCLLLLGLGHLQAAVYSGLDLTYLQPDGTPVPVKLYGDDFVAWPETLAGYTLVEDPVDRTWCFAIRGPDGDLASTGVRPDRGDGAALGLDRRVRETSDVIQAKASRARSARGFDQLDARWRSKVEARRAARQAGIRSAPPSSTTIGSFTGLVVLVDFSDAAGDDDMLPNIDNFLNADTFTNYGNSGSVKRFYHDVSNGKVTFLNQVNSRYLRLPNPKAYYNYVDGSPAKGFRSQGEAGYLLVTDTVNLLNAMSDAERLQIGIDYSALTVKGSASATTGGLDAVSIYFAGGSSGLWSKGLWPHSMPYGMHISLAGNAGSKFIEKYQVTDIGNSLVLGTFVHECGHMLCDFPDLYNYKTVTQEGVGRFCLMDDGSHNNNSRTPARPCAYLRYVAGWQDDHLVDLPTLGLAAIGNQTTANETVFFYGKNRNSSQAAGLADDPTEYFLIENRNNLTSGMIWDRYLPDSGLAIWHVDELSTNSVTPYTMHKECVLVQADGRDDLGLVANYGDSSDLFHRGSTAAFGDRTTPSAHWWNGSVSGLNITSIGDPGDGITFRFGPDVPYFYSHPSSPWMAIAGRTAFIQVVVVGDPTPTLQWERSLDSGGTWQAIPGATTSTLSILVDQADFGSLYRCVATNANGTTTSEPTMLAEIPPPTPPTTSSATPSTPPPSSAQIADDRGRCGVGSGMAAVLLGGGLFLLLRRRRSSV